MPEWVTVEEAAQLAGRSISTLRKWKADLPTKHEDGRLMFDRDAVVEKAGSATRPEVPPPQPAPTGTDLVLREAVASMHQLADRLATAEARAAKAETEAAFLREQLREAKTDHVPPGTAPRRWWRRS